MGVLNWKHVTGAVAALAVIVPAAWQGFSWIITRAHADEVQTVTQQVARTADAVEGLTVIVYQDQIKHAQEELAALRVEKRQHAATWSAEDEARLLATEQRIRNLQTQLDELLKNAGTD